MKTHLQALLAIVACSSSSTAVAAPAAPLGDPDGSCSPQEEQQAECFQSPGGFVVEIVTGASGEFPVVDSAGNSHFSYLVTGPGAAGGNCQGVQDVSHVDILVPVCPDDPLVILDAIPAGELLTNGQGDPSCSFGTGDLDHDVFKWDVGVSCDGSGLFTLVLEGAVAAAPNSFLLKEGPDCNVGTILGPACGTPPGCTGSIGDFVWLDLDGDGIQLDGEPGIEGVTLRLLNASNEEIAATQSGAEGAYLFPDLCPGTYTVVVDESTLPEGVEVSPCMAGGDPGLDSNCSPAAVVLTIEEPTDLTVDFGYHPVPFIFCESEPNSTGGNGEMNWDGNPSISENDFTLIVTGLPPGQPGYFFYGTAQVELPFGDGVRCIGGTVTRYRKIGINVGGMTEVTFDFTLPPLDDIVPGTPYYFQLWYRDPQSGGAGFNTSDAICVTFAP